MPNEVSGNYKESGVSYLVSQQDLGHWTFENDFDGSYPNGYNPQNLGIEHDADGKPTFLNESVSLPDGGKFAVPSNELDALMEEAQNDPEGMAARLQPQIDRLNEARAERGEKPYELQDHSSLRLTEASLGMEQGKLGNCAVRIDVPYSDSLGLQTPSGTEQGANALHLEGEGKTLGGQSEAVITNPYAVNGESISLCPNKSPAQQQYINNATDNAPSGEGQAAGMENGPGESTDHGVSEGTSANVSGQGVGE